MKLVPNAGQVLARAWSVRFGAAAALFASLEGLHATIAPLLPFDLPKGTFLALSGVCAALVTVARVIAQDGITPPPGDNQN